MRRITAFVPVLAAWLVVGCSSDSVPSAPVDDGAVHLQIFDGAHGGNPHFYFLPPLAPEPHPTGTFDPSLFPIVQICTLDHSGHCTRPYVALYSRTGGADRITVDGTHYQVNVHIADLHIADGVYRVTVKVHGVELGHADVFVGDEAQAHENDGLGRAVNGGTFPIKFIIEEGAVSTTPAGHILFTSTQTRHDEIYVINPDGTGLTQLTTTVGGISATPAWSPDGSRIAFARSSGPGQVDIFLMDANGGNVTQLTTLGHAAFPSWSPDGSKIAFHGFPDGNFDIYVINVDGTELVRLATDPGMDEFPVWSPDGSKLVFASDRADGNFDLYSMNPNGSALKRLTTTGTVDALPAWSPDGSRIAFSAGSQIFTMAPDGTNVTRVTNDSFLNTWPSWSPDGNSLVFSSNRAGGDYQLFTIDASGNNLVELTKNVWANLYPTWGP